MSAKRFLDTNVFVYQLDRSAPEKSDIADDVIGDAVATGSGCISYQVVQECLNVMLRKARTPLTPGEAGAYLDHVLAPLLQVGASVDLFRQALNIQIRYRFHFYDSLIVAAALRAGCRELITEDLQNGQLIETLTVRNPFSV